MAQTDKEKWLEGAEEYGAPLEDWKKVPVVTEAEIDETMSVPGVKYSIDPSVSTKATPQGFVQLHLGSLFSKISGLEGDVEEAIQDAETAAGNANTAAARTESAVTAADAATTRANTAATGADKVDASLVGMTITITDRNGVSVSTNIGFDIYRTYSSVAQMNADAPNVPEGKFVMIATTDPTDPENAQLYGKNSQGGFTFLSDLDQASSAAWADWLDNMKPQIEADHTRAATDHTTATQDHTQATQDHGVATQDHTRAESDHATATTDHTTANTDHAQASSDHTRAESDHTTASSDHTVATEDHITAVMSQNAVTNALSGKADKVSTVSEVTYDSSANMLKQTINGVTTGITPVVQSGFVPQFNGTTGIMELNPVGGATIAPNATTGIIEMTF